MSWGLTLLLVCDVCNDTAQVAVEDGDRINVLDLFSDWHELPEGGFCCEGCVDGPHRLEEGRGRDDDDGRTYADPRDERDERRSS